MLEKVSPVSLISPISPPGRSTRARTSELRTSLVRAVVLVALTVALAGSSSAGAVTCNVPSQRSTIQIAVLDNSCTTIRIARGTYYETVEIHRSLTMIGLGNGPTIAARVTVSDPNVVVTLSNLKINTDLVAKKCFLDALRLTGGARIESANLTVVNAGGYGPCSFYQLLFADDFETGNISRWSGSVGRGIDQPTTTDSVSSVSLPPSGPE